MKTTSPSDDPVRRMDEICEQLSALYSKADRLLDSYVDAVCRRNRPPEPGSREALIAGLVQQHRRLEDA